MINTLKVEYADTLPDAMQKTSKEFEFEARLAMATKLYEMQRLSTGQAAQLAGMPRVEFIMRLKDFGVPLLNQSGDDLLDDIENA